VKFDKSKEIEAQVLKDIALLEEKTNPLAALVDELDAVNAWRRRK